MDNTQHTQSVAATPGAGENPAQAHGRQLQTDQRLNSILASLDDAVWSVLPDTFQTVYMSPAAIKVYGHPAEAFYRDPGLWQKLVFPEDMAHINNKMPLLFENNALDFDYRITWPNGELHWLHDHVRVIRDASGKPVRLDGIAVDITPHKLAEEKLRKNHDELQAAYSQLQDAQGQLLQSEKMASIGQLAAGVAHEINNPIGYVYSNLGSLQKYINDLLLVLSTYEQYESGLAQQPQALEAIRAVKQKVDLEFIKEDVAALMNESREGITRVKTIVQNLKDFSHAGVDEEWQWADLRQGLESTLSIVWNELKYKAVVKKEYGEIPSVECLPLQLNQVFMNLLVNAAHAIAEKGVITIRTGCHDDQVWVEISDTGSGIAPEHINRIFDPFFTTKPVGKGTGLGLSVSYNIIQKHHGSIDVASELDHGTTFHIQLPVKQPVTTDA